MNQNIQVPGTFLYNEIKLDQTCEIENYESIFDLKKITSAIYKESLILLTNVDGEIIWLNKKCGELLGYRPKELIGKHTRIFKTGIHSQEFYEELWATLLSGKVWKGEITAKRKDGLYRWFFVLITPLLDEEQKPYQFLTLRFDITERKNIEKKLQMNEKQLHSLVDILTNTVVGFIDEKGFITYLSPAVENILGFNVTEGLGLSLYDYIDPKSLPSFKKTLEDIIKVPGGSQTVEVKLKRKDYSTLPCRFTAKNFLHDPVLKSIVFSYQDISAQEMFTSEINSLVYYDSLTGLPNQRYFEEQLRKEMEHLKGSSENLAIVMFGLDDFIYVNSTLGHQVGDQLLVAFSERISHSLPKQVTMYRMTGDIFLLLIKKIEDAEGVSLLLNDLITDLNNHPFHMMEHEIFLTVSMGVSIFPFSGENSEGLLRNAEMAMYRAKNNGKNQFQIFSPTMNLSSYKQFTLRNDAKHALQRNEFVIYYQPRVNPITNKMVSAEALIRWNHNKWGMVLPGEFISMAEDSGLIVPIGEWLIRKICSLLKQWEKEGLPLIKISINLSSLQLMQSNFVELVSTILTEYNVDPKWLEFEITETIIIAREEKILEKITELKDLGITIALDDFGTGYSSLNYLKKFPCDIIKLDKSLIDDIHEDRDSYEIIGTLIALCHRLKKTVVAEGVETKEQLGLLRRLNCDEVQGYLYSKPVHENVFKKMLTNGLVISGEKEILNIDFNRRRYFRVPLDRPLVADMTIHKIGEKRIDIDSTEVIVKDIGEGGLSFYSPIKLPISNDIILNFTTEILSEAVNVKGIIVWFKETDSSYYRYGIRFLFANGDRKKLAELLKEFEKRQQSGSVLPGCRYYRD